MFRLPVFLTAVAAILTVCQGVCVFPSHWTGKWFQSGIPSLLSVNSTHIETKGQCYESSLDKFILYERDENCYRCVVIYEKHNTVLQYKESYCDRKASLDFICGSMVGDAPLFSMFRVEPKPVPQPCPFRGAPFSFGYNKGTGECANPPSKAESCTDDSRLLLKYQACPDVHATESNVEELVCLASWKEGSIKYLVGKISQITRRIDSNEENYRCFVYKKNSHDGKITYDIAQSADATCNGLSSVQNIIEGSKTMKLTSVDNQHNRCRFPSWITDHHKWHSLDHKKIYHFSHKNATLKITDDKSKSPPSQFVFGLTSDEQRKPTNIEMRLVCHSILSLDVKKVQIVAHVTEGCNSGHICMMFNKRDAGVIEVQQSVSYEENSDEACRYFDQTKVPYTTLITSTLQPRSCPNAGRYHVNPNILDVERRKRRQQAGVDSTDNASPPVECNAREYESLDIGCSTNDEMMEFKSACSSTAYTCHGSWQENGVHYLIAAPISRKSNDVRRFCFIYTHSGTTENESSTESQFGLVRTRLPRTTRPTMHLSVLTESCHRDIVPGHTAKAFNLSSNGTCAESSMYSNGASLALALPAVVYTVAMLATVISRR